MIQTTVWVLYAEFVNATASLLKWLRRFATKSYHYRNHRLEYWLLGIQAKSSTTGFCLQFQQTPSCTWHNWTATTHHFWFFSTTEFTRPESGGLCHLVWHSATRVWDQSSWHRWAATSSTACVVRSLEQSLIDDAVDQCPTTLCVLVYVPEADILNILCDYQFVFAVLDELYVSHRAWCSRWCSKSAL